MSWFKADDNLPFHHKTLKAGNAAMGLWIRAGTWLRKQQRDDAPGVMTVAEARTMGTAAEVNRLIAAGFWEPCKYDGVKAIRFHDWAMYQPEAESVEAKRTDWAERKRRSRAHKSGDHSWCLPAYCDDAPPLPESSPDYGQEHG